MATRVHEAITALVAALTAGIPAELATVIDGPLLSGDTPATVVFVGYDGDPAGEWAATSDWQQTWAGIGAQRKDERFTVPCCVISGSGDEDVAPRRAAALEVLGLVEDVLRASANIGLGLPQPTTVAFASGQLRQEPVSGMRARIPFGVSVQTRI